MITLRLLAFVFMLLIAACGGGGGGFASDGGVSGTGISAVTGNVTEITGSDGNVAGVVVTVAGTDLRAETDANGFFTVVGEFDGPVTLIFARPADGLSVQVGVLVPAGGNLELADIVLDKPTGTARPARREVSFRGRIDVVDCLGNRLFVVSRFESARLIFTIQLDRMILRESGGPAIRCDQLRPGLNVVVTGIVQADESLADGEIVVAPATDPTPTRTRLAPTPRESPRPLPSATADAPPTRPAPTVEPTPIDEPVRPTPTEGTVRRTERPVRPTATLTRVRSRTPRPTPTRTPQRDRQPKVAEKGPSASLLGRSLVRRSAIDRSLRLRSLLPPSRS